jgi:threonine dehydrogenase-like Zn-dependent dehydrogenase
MTVEARASRRPSAEEVVVQVKACGVCGTDVHIFEGAEGAAKTTPPTVLGHEFSGVVSEIGSAVKGIKVGDRVCVDPNDMCGECFYCRQGKAHFCENMVGIGTTVDGGFAEFCTVREKQIHRIPDSLSFAEAAMAEPLACCLHGMDLTGVTPGQTVLIVGGGTIGLLMLQLARLSGAATLILAEPVAAKREMGRRLGADAAFDPLTEDLGEVLRRLAVHSIDAAIECVGTTGTMRYAIDHTGKGGVAMLFGLTGPDAVMEVLPFDIFRREIAIKASFINPYTQSRAVELLGHGKVDVKSLITDEVPLEEIGSIFQTRKYAGRGKIIVTP